MTRLRTLIWAFFFFALAFHANASVVINEIAWMGTVTSESDEWIELHNNGTDAVDLTGWHIVADDGTPSVTLTGSIAANGYFLLERTDDDSVPSVTADQFYAGALSNTTGETLRLKDGADATLDVVVSGENWANVGGDNTSKDTAQRAGSGWITAPGTPRAQNVSVSAVPQTTTDGDGEVLGANTTTNAGTVSSGNTGGSVQQKSPYPRATISISAGDDKRAFTNFPVTFTAAAKGLYDEPIPYATYRWNFGDGAQGEGVSPEHAYVFPGEYIVTLEVFWSTYHEKDRLTVTVSNAEMVIGTVIAGPGGYIELANRTEREIDLSGWRISDGFRTFVFPSNTAVLSGKKLLLPNKNTLLLPAERSPLTLFYPSGAAAFAEPLPIKAPPTQGVVRGVSTTNKNTAVTGSTLAANTSASSADGEATSTPGGMVLWKNDVSGQAAGVGAFPLGLSRTMQWALAVACLLLIVLAGYLLRASRLSEVSVADEYAVIEDIIEGEEDLARESDRLHRS